MQLGDVRSGKMADNLTGFARALRRAGIPVDSARMALATQALLEVGIARKDDVKHTFETVFVSRAQDREVFAQLFEAFFRNPEIAQKLLSQMLPKAEGASPPPKRRARVQEALTAVHATADSGNKKDIELDLDAAMTASDSERLRHADFQSLSASEYQLVERLAKQVPLALPSILGRRQISHYRGSRLDWSRALRDTQRLGGELLTLPHLRRKPQPLPLLVLIDVSGSMERYARLMLAFLHQATRTSPRSVFAFGTHLTDLRPAFKLRDGDEMLERVNATVNDFAGGTRLGDALVELQRDHKRLLVGKRTVVLLISDGLDTGAPEMLDKQLQWLKLHSRRLIWLNPLLRFDAYAPIARGAAQLHRHADAMLAIHNLSRLEDLADAISQLLKNKM